MIRLKNFIRNGVLTARMKNKGKIFEEDFKNSIDDKDILCIRLRDQPQVFKKTAKYSHNNPCDFIAFRKNHLFCLELKSTKKKYMTFDDIFKKDVDESQLNGMIHRHQIVGLAKFYSYEGVSAGFILNFRNENEMTQESYYISIKCFMNMIYDIDKQSFNINDLKEHGAITIEGTKKRTRYKWNIEKLMNNIILEDE